MDILKWGCMRYLSIVYYLQFGEAGRRTDTEAKQCTAVDRSSSKNVFSHLKKKNLVLVYAIFSLFYLAVRQPILWHCIFSHLHTFFRVTSVFLCINATVQSPVFRPRSAVWVRLSAVCGRQVQENK